MNKHINEKYTIMSTVVPLHLHKYNNTLNTYIGSRQKILLIFKVIFNIFIHINDINVLYSF